MKTELEKMERVKKSSQAIGGFLEWLFETKKYHLARYLTDEEYEGEGNVWFDDALASLYENGGSIKRHTIGKGELMPIHIDIEKILAEFFEINLVKVEEERRKLLEETGGKKENEEENGR